MAQQQAQDRVVSEAKVLGWIKSFESDPELHTQFPVTLKNGKTVPAIGVRCTKCGNLIDNETVHGRVVQSLPHVVTVEANALCVACDRLTHIDCRFRVNGDDAVVEWLGSNGQWMAKDYRAPTLGEKITGDLRRLVAQFSGT